MTQLPWLLACYTCDTHRHKVVSETSNFLKQIPKCKCWIKNEHRTPYESEPDDPTNIHQPQAMMQVMHPNCGGLHIFSAHVNLNDILDATWFCFVFSIGGCKLAWLEVKVQSISCSTFLEIWITFANLVNLDLLNATWHLARARQPISVKSRPFCFTLQLPPPAPSTNLTISFQSWGTQAPNTNHNSNFRNTSFNLQSKQPASCGGWGWLMKN